MHGLERKETDVMTKRRIGTREEWLAARLELLEAEKELTRHGDEVAKRRQELPWVRLDQEYRFDTDDDNAALKDLFRGRAQFLVYHTYSTYEHGVDPFFGVYHWLDRAPRRGGRSGAGRSRRSPSLFLRHTSPKAIALGRTVGPATPDKPTPTTGDRAYPFVAPSVRPRMK
jgi:predicted dithiol-disulfide oxidoreductase (DUF899 family)